MDLVALLVLGTLAVSGLVTPPQAFAGFSNSAVITVWAMFILSDGLTRTGIADVISRQVMRLAGRREIPMIIVIMVTAAVLSAFMNNIGVAALMLPVVVDIARRTRIPVSRLLMPLAYSTLLGGLMTLIGTPPNLLVSEALTQNGYEPFALFDFAPVGGAVMVVGVIFVCGDRPCHAAEDSCRTQLNTEVSAACGSRYKLQERTFMLRVPGGFRSGRQDAVRDSHRCIDGLDYHGAGAFRQKRDAAKPTNSAACRRPDTGARTPRPVYGIAETEWTCDRARGTGAQVDGGVKDCLRGSPHCRGLTTCRRIDQARGVQNEIRCQRRRHSSQR